MNASGQQSALAVIIGRGGSRGLPGKNAMMIAGEPMICHTIRDAAEARCVDRIVVSTDGEAIARAARSMNVEVIDRPPELAGDTAAIDGAVRHAVHTCGARHTMLVILYANVPVRPEGLLDRACELLHTTGADSVQSYCDVGKYHPYWMVRMDADSRIHQHHANTTYRRQDLPPLLIPDGGVIALTRESLLREEPNKPHAFLGDDRRGIVTNPGDVIDVDNKLDAALAEIILLKRPATVETEALLS